MFETIFVRVPTNGIHLNVAQAGPADGPLLIFLHGFPEFWYGWRNQIEHFASLGYRVWAPDQRGYNLSDKPKGLDAYQLEELAADICGLIDTTDQGRVFLVGHDWGAMVAWWIALTAPERLRRMAILNVPHPSVMRRHILTDPRQMARSTYAGFFQLPRLPEALLGAGNWNALARSLQNGSLPGAFTDDDLDIYRRAWSQPGAMTSMLNWYRALFRRLNDTMPVERVTVPTTVIWGKKDFALRSVMAEESEALCDAGELVWLPDNTHWVQHEAADRINPLLINRFTEPG